MKRPKSKSKLPTKETPKVLHFTRFRGNTGKSTARMARIVMSIIWAQYVVNAGRGGIRTGLLDVEADETRGRRKGRGTPLLGLGK